MLIEIKHDVLTTEEVVCLYLKTKAIVDLYKISAPINIILDANLVSHSGQINIIFYKEIDLTREFIIRIARLGYVSEGFTHTLTTLDHELAHIITYVKYKHVDHNEDFADAVKEIKKPVVIDIVTSRPLI